MGHVIGYIFKNEGFSMVRVGGTPINTFMVNKSDKPIVVYGERMSSMDTVVKIQSSSGSWRWGYVPGEHIIYNQCSSIGTRGIREFVAAINGKSYNIVRARGYLRRYDRQGNHVGMIPSGYYIAFPGEGTCGASKPDRLYAAYYKKPGAANWSRVAYKSDGWIDTACSYAGYKSRWGLNHLKN